MMKKETSNPLKKLAALLLIPVAGFFLWAFAEPEYHVNATEVTQQTSNVNLSANDSVKVKKSKTRVTVVKVTTTVSRKDTLKSESKVHQNFSPLVFIDGKESAAALNKISREQIEPDSIIKDETATTILQNGKYTTCDDQEHPHFYFNLTKANKSLPLIFIDGKESAVSIKDIDPDRIESVSVLKNESATSVYGEKGKNGVILITTKRINKSPERTVKMGQSLSLQKNNSELKNR